MNNSDAIVIGGGVIGSAITYYLSKKGLKVTLVEKKDLAGGTSGACDKAIMLQSKRPGLHLELALASAGIYETLSEELSWDLEYSKNGGMIIIENEQEWEIMRGIVERQQQAGVGVRLINREEALERQPMLAPGILGSTYWEGDAEINPMQVVIGFAQAAQKLGASLILHTTVRGLLVQNHKVVGVETDRGDFKAPKVINAMGVWAPELAAAVGLDIPIKPRRGQILVSQPLPQVIRGDILSARYIAAKHHPELVQQATESAAKLGVGLAMGQTANGNLLIGATREFVGYDRRTTLEGIREVAKNAVRLFPFLKKVNIIRTFAGLRPFTPDGLPLLGKVPGVAGFYVAAGHEGDGIAMAPWTGKLMADLVYEEELGMDLSPFRPERFTKEGSQQNVG